MRRKNTSTSTGFQVWRIKLFYYQFSRDIMASMLVYRTKAKKVSWEFDSIIMQNLSDILSLFCTPTWPSHHVSENQELSLSVISKCISLRVDVNSSSSVYNFTEKMETWST